MIFVESSSLTTEYKLSSMAWSNFPSPALQRQAHSTGEDVSGRNDVPKVTQRQQPREQGEDGGMSLTLGLVLLIVISSWELEMHTNFVHMKNVEYLSNLCICSLRAVSCVIKNRA